jgi:hypothetical protein
VRDLYVSTFRGPIAGGASQLRGEPDLDDRFSSAVAVGNLDFGGRSQRAPLGYSGGSGALARQPALNLSSISVEAQCLPRNALIFAASRRLGEAKFAVWTRRVPDGNILFKRAKSRVIKPIV